MTVYPGRPDNAAFRGAVRPGAKHRWGIANDSAIGGNKTYPQSLSDTYCFFQYFY